MSMTESAWKVNSRACRSWLGQVCGVLQHRHGHRCTEDRRLGCFGGNIVSEEAVRDKEAMVDVRGGFTTGTVEWTASLVNHLGFLAGEHLLSR